MSKQKPPEQTKADPETEALALEAQIASATLALEAQRAKAAEAKAAAAVQAAERQKRIEAEALEQKINMFVAAANQLDHGMTAAALATFKKLAAEIFFAGRLRQAHAAREHLIARMLGQTVYKPPYPSWSAMAQAWLIPKPEPEQTKTEEQTQKVA